MLRKRRFFQVSAMALLSVCASCQTTGHKPLLSEAVIAAAAIYESPEDRQLVLKHQDSLNAIFQGIRKRFRPPNWNFFSSRVFASASSRSRIEMTPISPSTPGVPPHSKTAKLRLKNGPPPSLPNTASRCSPSRLQKRRCWRMRMWRE